jgi:hypothetical protein
MTAPWRMLCGVSAVAFCLGIAGTAWAQQDPNTGGQLNQCWGQIASQTAKLDTPEGTSGGGMGQHSRSTQAANNNGGFAANNEEFGPNGFGIEFNTDGGRLGVGNATRGAPHFAEPGDGGNGQHAINNGSDVENGLGLSTVLDPVTGDFLPAGEVVELTCELP